MMKNSYFLRFLTSRKYNINKQLDLESTKKHNAGGKGAGGSGEEGRGEFQHPACYQKTNTVIITIACVQYQKRT